jgi:hypothetical protein
MKPVYTFSALILLILSSSCATLSVADIRNLDRTEFEPLTLKPDFEIHEMRLDLIRQTYEHTVNDSTLETLDSPYHPLGFDLGNGLFYDLNENLCFRLDYLLGYSDQDCFDIKRIDRRNRKRPDCVYTFCDNTLTRTYPPGRIKHYQYHWVTDGATTSVKRRNRILYDIKEDGSSVIYGKKRRKYDTIQRVDENHYYLNHNKKREKYQLEENRVYLENDYIIELTDQNRKIEIKRRGLFRDHTWLTLEKGRDILYIYGRNYSGKKIEFSYDGITVYRDKTFLTRWTVEPGE